jgi:hypothetical protein
MRRFVAGLAAAALGALPAAPFPSPSPTVVSTATMVCTVTDPQAVGLSGLVVTSTGFVAISDSNFDRSKVRIWYLDQQCRATRSVGYPTAAYDPEDAAMGRDGSLYVADFGDNGKTRHSIAVWRLRPGSEIPQIYRYAYPDGPHDAEAILLAADDSPVIVTKDPFTAGLYVPTGPADPSGSPVPLRKVGQFELTPTDTPSGVGIFGGFIVTGGANSADRRRVALRSYSDAYEWNVPDGDVVKAITTTKPRMTPLPDEAQGESIAYAQDGRSFYTISDVETDPMRAPILRYPSALVPASAGPTLAAGGAVAAALSKHWPVLALGGAILLGLLLAVVGVWALVRSRRADRYSGPEGDPVR